MSYLVTLISFIRSQFSRNSNLFENTSQIDPSDDILPCRLCWQLLTDLDLPIK